MAKVPVLVVVMACTTGVLFLLSSMFLLSSIIVWLSLEFSGPLPHILGFVVGVISLLDAFIAILMIGIPHLRKTLGFVFLIASVVSLFASIALLVPFILSFTTFCGDCTQMEHTLECVQACNDECCFTNLSLPLAIVFIVFTAITLLSSLAGIAVAVPYIWYAYNAPDNKQL